MPIYLSVLSDVLPSVKQMVSNLGSCNITTIKSTTSDLVSLFAFFAILIAFFILIVYYINKKNFNFFSNIYYE